ncbi:MAG: pyrimidine/purine nucleoside phosphorylase [Burkholderiales bacterium]
MTGAQFDNVSIVKKANVYFDGKCVSHTVIFKDGTKKSVGVIFPSTLTFNTGAPEVMEINGGVCKVKLPGASEWRTVRAGEKFEVAGNAKFDIETLETLDYVCHFG